MEIDIRRAMILAKLESIFALPFPLAVSSALVDGLVAVMDAGGGVDVVNASWEAALDKAFGSRAAWELIARK